MTTVLTIPGLGWEQSDIMNTLLFNKKFPSTGGRIYQRLDFDILDSILTAGNKLNTTIDEISGDIIVYGHSKGSQIASWWLRTYGISRASLASRVSFILCGNPERRYGGRATLTWPVNGCFAHECPDDTAFTVTDIARRKDGWCNWPLHDNIFNPNWWDIGLQARAFGGLLTTHLFYNFDLTTLETQHIDSTVVGNTTYHLMP